MPLSDFIADSADEIIKEFGAFARTLMPSDSSMTESELRDHAADMLSAIVQDMNTEQTADEEWKKSTGLGILRSMAASGRLHADARLQHGFTPDNLLAEFRALRASVLRLYELSGDADLVGVRRFNEAIDEALAESMIRYRLQTDLYKNQFIGVLSHDLRTPLAAIVAGAGLLAASPESDHRQARVAGLILNSAQRMSRMIADLLDLTRARLGGALPLNRTTTDLERVCEEVVLELQAGHSGVAVNFTAGGDLTGEWDSDRLSQVVSNLVANAIQHGDGSTVSVQASGRDGEVILTVHNRGIPIPRDAQGSIFEPLARAGSSRGANRSGIGLGLFIAHAIIMAHGGEIGVSSSETLGTTFRIALPRRRLP